MSSGNALAFAGAALIGVAVLAPTLKSGGGSTPAGNGAAPIADAVSK